MRVKTTYLGPTNTEGPRIRVHVFGANSEMNRVLPYDYSAPNPHCAAIRASFGREVEIHYTKDHARGYWYEVT